LNEVCAKQTYVLPGHISFTSNIKRPGLIRCKYTGDRVEIPLPFISHGQFTQHNLFYCITALPGTEYLQMIHG